MRKIKIRPLSAVPLIDYKRDLNEEQRSVVLHPGGPMLVIAGAGSGKTRTVTYRVARLIETGTHPSAIMLLTFTNRAAREMMQRVEALTGGHLTGLWGGTFHHIGNIILRRHAGLLGYKEDFTILDREDQKELLEDSLSELKIKETSAPKGAVLAELVSYHKNTLTPLDDLFHGRYFHVIDFAGEIERALSIYESRKKRLNLMDFDDLLIQTLTLLREHQELREFYASRFLHVLVDEYQDTNILQAQFIDLIGYVHRNVMVVGDDAQSIYSFRGARIDNILTFPQRYPDARIFKLTTNYRSTPEILNLSNRSIEHNRAQFHKELKAILPSAQKPLVVKLSDTFEQCRFVASMITDLTEQGMPRREIAVLYRSHYQSMEIQLELQRRGIPFEVRSGLRFFEQAHIKDVMAFLRILHNPYDELSWKRILKMIPKIGGVTANRIWEFISMTENPLTAIGEAERLLNRSATEGFRIFSDQIEGLLDTDYRNNPAEAILYLLEHGYEDYLYNTYPNGESRYEDLVQLVKYAEAYAQGRADLLVPEEGMLNLPYTSLERLLSDLTLERVTGDEDTEAGGVVLSTIHQAKGLEWNTVFIIGLNDGRFPSRRSLAQEGLEEERRLFYVACTRAKKLLILCYTLTDNGYSILEPSRFLTELPDDVYEEVEIEYGI